MKTIIAIFSLAIFFGACTKSKQQSSIQVRVSNQSANTITDVKLYSVAPGTGADQAQLYGTLVQNSTSDYVSYRELNSIPLISYSISGSATVSIDRVRCASPMPPSLESGHYSLVIKGEANSPEVFFEKDAD